MTRVFSIVFLGFLNSVVLAQKIYVIRNVTLIPMNTEKTLAGQTVTIENGKIGQVGSQDKIRIPKEAIVIDGTGKYLIPGLFDMHAHFFFEQGNHINT